MEDTLNKNEKIKDDLKKKYTKTFLIPLKFPGLAQHSKNFLHNLLQISKSMK
jgi:hypothetical protein